MNHLLQHSLGTANVRSICTFYLQYHPLLFEVCHMCIFTNAQEVRRNLFNFFNACNIFIFNNSQEIVIVRGLYTFFFSTSKHLL